MISDLWFFSEHWKAIVICIVLIAVVLPFLSVFSSIATIITPALTACVEFIVWFIKENIAGIKIVLASLAAIVFFVCSLIGVALYIHGVDNNLFNNKLEESHNADVKYYENLLKQQKTKVIYKDKIVYRDKEPEVKYITVKPKPAPVSKSYYNDWKWW